MINNVSTKDSCKQSAWENFAKRMRENEEEREIKKRKRERERNEKG